MTLRELMRISFIASSLFTASLTARADAFEDGMAAYIAGDYDDAVAQWKPLAAQHHARAAYTLGFMYEFGYGVAINEAESFKWYLQAAQQGHQLAQRTVTWMFERGKGDQQDRAEASRQISTL